MPDPGFGVFFGLQNHLLHLNRKQSFGLTSRHPRPQKLKATGPLDAAGTCWPMAVATSPCIDLKQPRHRLDEYTRGH